MNKLYTFSSCHRVQHSIMAHFYPWREKERAVWLYNSILRQRGGVARWLRRNLRRRKILGGSSLYALSTVVVVVVVVDDDIVVIVIIVTQEGICVDGRFEMNLKSGMFNFKRLGFSAAPGALASKTKYKY